MIKSVQRESLVFGSSGVSLKCPKCKSGQISRVQRYGFLEKKILCHLGFFPWECSICRRRIRVKTRGWSGQPEQAT
jgi:predicted RNA-binding Zn-ribbon protein involved in translation (DUF1610 family)